MQWCGFIGTWLLVAGPLYQAALELQDEDIEQEHLHAVRQTLPPPRPTSAWWWLFPPVRIVLARRRSDAYRRAFIAQLPDEDVESLLSFINKATGWLYVASGGLLLAINETYELCKHMEWSLAVCWLIAGVLAAGCVANTAVRMARSKRIIDRTHLE